MLELLCKTPDGWLDKVLSDFDAFLSDHAAAEKKASGMAMSMALHYPDKTALAAAMIDLAIEELMHFREIVKVMTNRGLILQKDEKDPYVNALNKLARKGSEHYFLDRLILGSVIEARGAERFGLIADALPAGQLKDLYLAITHSEDRHRDQFLDFARQYFPEPTVAARLREILSAEATIVRQLPLRAALH